MTRRLSVAAVAVTLAFAAFGAVLVSACKSKPGDACSGVTALCQDKGSALFCLDGTYLATSCRGDKGCAQNGPSIECDESIASEQDPCNAPDGIACSVDHKEALRCTNKHFVLDETCKGPTGCVLDSTQKISCDNDIADVNDPCHVDGDFACTTDKSLVMKCVGNKMTPHNTCRGPKQCRVVHLPKQDRVEFECDDSVAQEGDACDTNGEEACTMDHKGMFLCRGNKFGSLRSCVGGCTHDDKTDRYTCPDAPSTTDAAAPAAPPPPVPKRRGGRH